MGFRIYIIPALAFSLACLLSGCASGKLEFVRTGISVEQRHTDINACWKHALSPEGQDTAKLLKAAWILTTGALALVDMATAGKDPKKDTANIAVYNDCMTKKGYSSKFVSDK